MTHVHLPLTPQWLWWPQPWVWLLPLVPLVPALCWLWLHAGRRAVLRYSDLALIRKAGGNWRGRLRLILPGLRTVALGALLIAAARPQSPNETRRVQVEGIAIQMVLDCSSSMLDPDLSGPGEPVSRLDVVKDVFKRFVTGGGALPGRPNDLIGMIRFARYPDSVCPLTLDRAALLELLAVTRTVMYRDDYGRWRGDRNEDGTAIGDALALAIERLKDLKRTTGSGQQLVIRSRVIVLLTDGEDNASRIEPVKAGELAATCGIKVYTVLAGTGEAAGFGMRRPVRDEDLKRVAEVTGGQHFRATDRDALERIYAEIDKLERTRTEEQSYVEWSELAWPWLLAAFIALGLQIFLDATWLRKIP
ncbi:MAG: VWA domain-containing protein [Planctomycetota bacterium]